MSSLRRSLISILVSVAATHGCDAEERCDDQTSRSACESLDRGQGRACGWANVVHVDASGGCDASAARGRCVPTEYQGSGCGLHGVCASGELPNSFARLRSDGTSQMMYGDFCEFQPDPEWTPCWSEDANEPRLSPDAPLACACLCNGG